MGTAGPLALARQLLDDGSGKPFFVLNSDVVCPYPLKDMLDFHMAREAEATILVTKVQQQGWGAYTGIANSFEARGSNATKACLQVSLAAPSCISAALL